MVRRSVAPFHIENAVILDVVGELAADAAIRAQRIHRFVGDRQRDIARRHQRAGGTGLHALPATHAGGGAHRVVHVEHDLRVLAARGQADDIVGLLITAGAHAACALDAGIQVHGNGGMRQVCLHGGARRKTGLAHFELHGPFIDFIVPRVVALGHVRLQQFNDQLLRLAHALVVRGHLHPGAGCTAARCGEHAPALDFNHAGAAVSHCLHAGLVAQTRYFDAETICDLNERFVDRGGNLAAIEHERNGGGIRECAHLAGDGVHGVLLTEVRWESI
jgi:hypothetical protein